MHICIPVDDKNGKDAKTNAHFSQAPYFMNYDTETDSFSIIFNRNKNRIHDGICHPLNLLQQNDIDAVICESIGQRALNLLNKSGIKAFQTINGTVAHVLAAFHSNQLQEITEANCCGNPNCQLQAA